MLAHDRRYTEGMEKLKRALAAVATALFGGEASAQTPPLPQARDELVIPGGMEPQPIPEGERMNSSMLAHGHLSGGEDVSPIQIEPPPEPEKLDAEDVGEAIGVTHNRSVGGVDITGGVVETENETIVGIRARVRNNPQ